MKLWKDFWSATGKDVTSEIKSSIGSGLVGSLAGYSDLSGLSVSESLSVTIPGTSGDPIGPLNVVKDISGADGGISDKMAKTLKDIDQARQVALAVQLGMAKFDNTLPGGSVNQGQRRRSYDTQNKQESKKESTNKDAKEAAKQGDDKKGENIGVQTRVYDTKIDEINNKNWEIEQKNLAKRRAITDNVNQSFQKSMDEQGFEGNRYYSSSLLSDKVVGTEQGYEGVNHPIKISSGLIGIDTAGEWEPPKEIHTTSRVKIVEVHSAMSYGKYVKSLGTRPASQESSIQYYTVTKWVEFNIDFDVYSEQGGHDSKDSREFDTFNVNEANANYNELFNLQAKNNYQFFVKEYRDLSKVSKEENEFDYKKYSPIRLPKWGYDDFINERNIWIKGLYSPFNDPAYFYFKIFFDFNSLDGLIGGILNVGDNGITLGRNSAAKYLLRMGSSGAYRSEHMQDRLAALIKFVKLLSYINCNAPWFFSEVNGLQEAQVPILKEFSKERQISIKCSADAIDMRLTTLLDLYKFACYDDILNREIVPDNLRKFDMSILVFQVPIKKLHTKFTYSKSGKGVKTTFPYKTTYGSDPNNILSYKLFCFQNCEIDLKSIGNLTPANIKNDQPFQMGQGDIVIKYDKCLTYNSNEFNKILFGSTGFLFDAYTLFVKGNKAGTDQQDNEKNRLKAIFESYLSRKQPFTTSTNQLPLVEAAEQLAHNNLIKLSGLSLGNIYGQDLTTTGAPKQNSDDKFTIKTERDYTPYYSWKRFLLAPHTSKLLDSKSQIVKKILKWAKIKNNDDQLLKQDKYGNIIHDGSGYLFGAKDTKVGSEYWKEKLKRLKDKKVNNVYDYLTDDTEYNKLSVFKEYRYKTDYGFVKGISTPVSNKSLLPRKLFKWKGNDKKVRGLIENPNILRNPDTLDYPYTPKEEIMIEYGTDYDYQNNISNKSLLRDKLKKWKNGSLNEESNKKSYLFNSEKTQVGSDYWKNKIDQMTDNRVTNVYKLDPNNADTGKRRIEIRYGTDYDYINKVSNMSLLKSKLQKWKGNNEVNVVNTYDPSKVKEKWDEKLNQLKDGSIEGFGPNRNPKVNDLDKINKYKSNTIEGYGPNNNPTVTDPEKLDYWKRSNEDKIEGFGLNDNPRVNDEDKINKYKNGTLDVFAPNNNPTVTDEEKLNKWKNDNIEGFSPNNNPTVTDPDKLKKWKTDNIEGYSSSQNSSLSNDEKLNKLKNGSLDNIGNPISPRLSNQEKLDQLKNGHLDKSNMSSQAIRVTDEDKINKYKTSSIAGFGPNDNPSVTDDNKLERYKSNQITGYGKNDNPTVNDQDKIEKYKDGQIRGYGKNDNPTVNDQDKIEKYKTGQIRGYGKNDNPTVNDEDKIEKYKTGQIKGYGKNDNPTVNDEDKIEKYKTSTIRGYGKNDNPTVNDEEKIEKYKTSTIRGYGKNDNPTVNDGEKIEKYKTSTIRGFGKNDNPTVNDEEKIEKYKTSTIRGYGKNDNPTVNDEEKIDKAKRGTIKKGESIEGFAYNDKSISIEDKVTKWKGKKK